MLVAALFVFGVGLQQNLSRVSSSPFHPDESRWINRAEYPAEALHPLSAFWEDRYLILGQPPGGSYITGIGLLLQGRDLETNQAWNFEYGNETVTWWNASRGNMPAREDLVAARRTSAFLGAVTALAVFLIVLQVTNLAGAAAGGLFMAVHPLSVYLSSIAVSDAAFTTMVALSTLAGMALARQPSWSRAFLLGALLGIGASTKLSPLFIALALGAAGLIVVALPLLRRIPGLRAWIDYVPGLEPERTVRLGWKLMSLPAIAVLTFVATYPYLWPDPVGRTQGMFDFRRAEMENQARIWHTAAVTSRLNALERTWTMLEDRFSATGRLLGELTNSGAGWGFDLPIAIAGLLILLALSWRRGVTSPTAFATALIGLQGALILGGLLVDFDRYYLPIVFACAVGAGVFVASAWTLARRLGGFCSPARPAKMRPGQVVLAPDDDRQLNAETRLSFTLQHKRLARVRGHIEDHTA